VGILAAVATDSLTIIRLTKIDSTRDADFAYGFLILVNSSINSKNKSINANFFFHSISSIISYYWYFLPTYY